MFLGGGVVFVHPPFFRGLRGGGFLRFGIWMGLLGGVMGLGFLGHWDLG